MSTLNKRPLILGLTGSIAMGKSTVSQMFVDEDIPHFDADAAVHKLQGPGGALVDEIEAAFPGTTGPQGVDRLKLGPQVLGDKEKLTKLESIIHPAVGQMRAEFLDAHKERMRQLATKQKDTTTSMQQIKQQTKNTYHPTYPPKNIASAPTCPIVGPTVRHGI